MKNKFEYFLNAVHYSLWLIEIKSGKFADKIVNAILAPIPKYLFTKEYKKKYYERLPKEQKEIEKFFYGKRNGFHIGWAHHWFGYFYSGYPIFLSFVIFGVALRHFGTFSHPKIIVGAIFAFFIGLCYIPAYKAVFTKDRYLKYFKQFEKEDEQWHRKWKRITIVFCIGSIIVTLLGIGAMWAILLL